MSITREEIIRCYQDILRRKPESEEIIALHMQFKGNEEEFRQGLLNSREYKKRCNMLADKFDGIELLPAQALVKEDTDVWHCIELLESGAECLYLVDDEGRYLWRALVRKNCLLKADGNGGWHFLMESCAPLIFEKSLAGHEEELLGLARARFASCPEAGEILVVDSGGQLYAWHAQEKKSLIFLGQDLKIMF